jgi:hypothetical protein
MGHSMPQFVTLSPITADLRICSQAVHVTVMAEKWHWDRVLPANIIPPTLYKNLFVTEIYKFGN